MLLMEAKAEIDARLTEQMQKDYRKQIPWYFEALEIASKCIEKQMELCDQLNDMEQSLDIDSAAGVEYSVLEMYEALQEYCIYEPEQEVE